MEPETSVMSLAEDEARKLFLARSGNQPSSSRSSLRQVRFTSTIGDDGLVDR
jgi:hypothetical protein